MDKDFWYVLTAAVIVALFLFTVDSCDKRANETFKECIKTNTPAECQKAIQRINS